MGYALNYLSWVVHKILQLRISNKVFYLNVLCYRTNENVSYLPSNETHSLF